MKTINVQKPDYDLSSGLAAITIKDSQGGEAIINIDFKRVSAFARLVNKEVLDFFFMTAAVYGIDRFVKRKNNSIDGWSRELSVTFPVHNTSKWVNVKTELEQLLSFLTGDYWKIKFYKTQFNFPNKDLENEFSKTFSHVNLLSGGLDSLIGALDFLKSKPNENVLFVSHYDSQMNGPRGDQRKLIEKLKKIYPNQFSYVPSLKVSLSETNRKRETTFRSRSILFIGIALLVSQAKQIPKIIIPENGTVSLNYPLSPSRRSSCSTRTTHPLVIEKVSYIWKELGIQTYLCNPYEFKTKGEMVAECRDPLNLLQLIEDSNSCGKRGHRSHWTINPSASHCGVCMPCIYRQAALMGGQDKTEYGNSLNSLLPFNTKKSQDAGACLDFIKNPLTKDDIKKELIVNGVKDLTKINRFIDVVWRTREELKQWIKAVGNSSVKSKAGI